MEEQSTSAEEDVKKIFLFRQMVTEFKEADTVLDM